MHPLPAALVALLPLVLALAGSIRTRRSVRRLEEQRQREDDFLNGVRAYYRSGGEDRETYLRLVRTSSQIQADLGPLGVAAVYQPIGAQYLYKNYQIIINELQELQKWTQHDQVLSSLKPGLQTARTIEEAIVRHLGVTDGWLKTYAERLSNPVALLAEGTRWAMLLPFDIAVSLGIIPSTSVSAIRGSRFVLILSGLVGLLSALSSIATIVTSWKALLALFS